MTPADTRFPSADLCQRQRALGDLTSQSAELNKMNILTWLKPKIISECVK